MFSPFSVNGAVLNLYPINGIFSSGPFNGMAIEVVDCKNVIAQILVPYDHFAALNAGNWGLSGGLFVNTVARITGDFYAVNTSRLLPGVTYTLTANV